MTLFFRECKKVLFSLTYVIMIAAVIFMAFSQDAMDFTEHGISTPQEGMSTHSKTVDDPEIVMPAATQALYAEFMNNYYVSYPIGFYKGVKLNDTKQEKMAEILSQITGISVDDLYTIRNTTPIGGSFTFDENSKLVISEDGISATIPEETTPPDITPPSWVTDYIPVKDGLSYDEFKKYMNQADELIGGGTYYKESALIKFGRTDMTYEEEVEYYNLIKDNDKFTGAYTRLFCDYVCIVLSVIPVFVAVAMSLRDRTSGAYSLIYTKKSSSLKVIASRYSAIVMLTIIPALILCYISNISVWTLHSGEVLDYLAPVKYVLGWILPSVMISTAVGMCITELTNTPLAIAVQGLWWFIDINMGVSRLSGSYSLFTLTPRHNSLGNTQVFIDNFGTLAANRIIYTVVSLVIVCLTVYIYEMKRRGKLDGFKVFNRSNRSKHSKIESEA